MTDSFKVVRYCEIPDGVECAAFSGYTTEAHKSIILNEARGLNSSNRGVFGWHRKPLANIPRNCWCIVDSNALSQDTELGEYCP